MNIIQGYIKTGNYNHRWVLTENTARTESLYLNVERLTIGSSSTQKIFTNKSNTVVIGLIGYLSNLEALKYFLNFNQKEDVCVLGKLYETKGKEGFEMLEGLFTVVVHDTSLKKTYLFQDPYGFSMPLVYASIPEGMVFGTRLKNLLAEYFPQREFNLAAARDLLASKTMVPGKNTLLKGIYKLVPEKMLVVDHENGQIHEESFKRNLKTVPAEEAKKNLLSSIEKEVTNISRQVQTRKIAMPLSSGFDSNLLLHFLHDQFDSITAVTIGGQKISEIEKASCCSAHYSKVRHKSFTIQSNRLQKFPEIVWRTEGNVFESGLFLQYELSQGLTQSGATIVFLGDCADQQLKHQHNSYANQGRQSRLKNILKSIKIIRKVAGLILQKPIPAHIKWINPPTAPQQPYLHDIEKDYILKKSGMMMNSFGIQPVYPFLNRETHRLSLSLPAILCKKKRFYKKAVKKILTPNIARHLTKLGGATDIGYIVKDNPKVFEKVFQSKIVSAIIPEMSAKQKREIAKNMVGYSEFLLALLYLYLFNEMFVSKNFERISPREESVSVLMDDFFIPPNQPDAP